MLAELRQLFDYNRWANERMLDACAPLSHDELTRELGGSYPSAWSTLTHIYGGENSWFARWRGTPEGRPLNVASIAGLPALRDMWQVLWNEQAPWLETVTHETVCRVIPIRFRNGMSLEQQMAGTMRHLVNHSTYHRGQVTNFLRQLGAEPTSTDLVLYYMERPPVQW